MNKNKKSSLRWGLTLSALAAVGAIVYFFVPTGDPLSSAGALQTANALMKKELPINVVMVESKPIVEIINSTGTLSADETVDLSFESSGRITELNIAEGQKVSKGTLIAKINDVELQAQLAKLKIQHKLAEDREQRQHSLLAREAISQESYEQSLSEMQTLKADILQLEAKIEKSSVFAPFDGIVGLRYTSEGAFVQPGTPITQMVKITPLKVDFSIPERYAGIVKVGMPTQFKVDGYSTPFSARVYAIEPQIDIKTRTLTVRALYPNTREDLTPGRYVSVALQIHLFSDAIAIPSEALIPEMDGAKVFLYKEGKASPVNVEIGIRTETEIQITQGLHVGDTLITSGILQLRSGLPVVIGNVLQ